MKEKIEFKKSIIFKTTIAEITDINISHDYKIKSDTIEGTFSLSGLYKMTSASVKEEEFFYNIPFVIALSERIKKESINLNLFDFDYQIIKDTLNTKMILEMEYEENENIAKKTVDELIGSDLETKEEIILENPKEDIESEKVTLDDVDTITNNFNMDNSFVTYKVHIVREADTFENIASKYKASIEDIKLYNEQEILNIGDKVVVPSSKHD